MYDNVQPGQPRISIGGTLALTGIFGVDSSSPPFDTVRPESVMVSYGLRQAGVLGAPEGTAVGKLLIQMLDGSRIRVEAFPGAASPGGFSSAAQIYVR